MKIIPIMKCRNMERSLFFYTNILDFELKYPDISATDWVIDLINEDAEIQLSIHRGDSVFGAAVNVRVGNVDELFKKYLGRGLKVPSKGGVHGGPLDQTWGMREFYVDDPNGNTLRFGMPIE